MFLNKELSESNDREYSSADEYSDLQEDECLESRVQALQVFTILGLLFPLVILMRQDVIDQLVDTFRSFLKGCKVEFFGGILEIIRFLGWGGLWGGGLTL